MTQDLSVYNFRPAPRFVMLFVIAMLALAIYGFVRGVMDAGGLSFNFARGSGAAEEEIQPPISKSVNLPTSSVLTPPVVAAPPAPPPPAADAKAATAATNTPPATRPVAKEAVIPTPQPVAEPRVEAPPPPAPPPVEDSPTSTKGVY